MTINFTGDATLVALKEKILRVLQANELRPGQTPYELTYPAGGSSGWSFGQVQFDLASTNMIGRNTFLKVLLDAKDNNGNYVIDDGDPTTGRGSVTAVEDKKVTALYNNAIKKPNALSTEDVLLINSALQSSNGSQIIDDSVDLQITDLINYADNIILKAPEAEQSFLRQDIGYLWLIDLKNQGAFDLIGFLNGKSINGYTKQGACTFDDLVNVYFHQRKILIEKWKNGVRVINPWDPFRRLSNIIKETGYTPLSLDEAKGVLRAYTYLYVPYESELRATQARLDNVIQFRTYVAQPADQYLLDNWDATWGEKPTGDHDLILIGDDKDNKSSSGEYQLNGRDGNDIILGEGGNDEIKGGAGNDSLFGGTGNDKIDGGAGNDVIYGGENDDKLSGGLGNDILDGGAGNDILDGGGGNDTLKGGADDDIYFIGGTSWDDFLGLPGDSVTIDDTQGNNTITAFYNDSNGTPHMSMLNNFYSKGKDTNVWVSPDGTIEATHNSPWTFTFEDGWEGNTEHSAMSFGAILIVNQGRRAA